MKHCAYDALAGLAWPGECQEDLEAIRELRASTQERLKRRPDFFDFILKRALPECAHASCTFTCPVIPKERIAWIGWGGKRPKTDHEREVLDLRDALAEVCWRHGEMDVDPQTLRSLHRTAARTGAPRGAGRFRLGKARLADEWPGHQGMAELETLAAEELPFAVERLCLAWTEASRRESVDGIMLAAAAVADFVCMAPFAWGMGRMSRLLTSFLLCKAGVDPIACAFTNTSLHNAEEDYADALAASCQGWREGTGDPMPFAAFLLWNVRDAYEIYEDGAAALEEQRERQGR